MNRPYLVFILGWGSKREWARSWLAYLRPGLVARGLLAGDAVEGRDFDAFSWAPRNELLWSMARSTQSAARDLARLLNGRQNATVLGHSKGGCLALEYAAQVVEGRLPAEPGVARIISINAPLDNWGGRVARAAFDPRRLAQIEPRLAARGVNARVSVIYDPTDPISCPVAVDGIACRTHTSGLGPPRAGRTWRSLMVWNSNHLACFRTGWPDVLGDLSEERVAVVG